MEIRPDMIFCGCLVMGVFAVFGFILIHEYMADRRQTKHAVQTREPEPGKHPINYIVNHYHIYQCHCQIQNADYQALPELRQLPHEIRKLIEQ